MANTGFQIGRGINLAARFALGASGAGAGTSGGLPAIGTSLLNQGAGGSTAVGQTMSSLTGAQPQKVPLLERFRGGMSAISPEFAQAQDLQSIARQRQSTTQLNTAQLQETRMNNQILPFDKITSNLTPTARQKVEDTLMREGLIIEEGGIKGIRTGDAKQRMKEMFDEPKEQLTLYQTMRKDYEGDIKKVEFHRERHINTLIDKELKDKGLKEGSVELKTARDNIRKLIVEDGLIDSPELKGYDSEREALKGRLQPILDNEQMILQTMERDLKLSAKAAARDTVFIPNEDGTFTMGFTDELTGEFKPLKGENGMPVKLTEKQVLLSQGKRAESLVEPFKVGFDTASGREAGKLKTELENQIVKATQSNQTIQNGINLLDSESGTFSGPLANIKVGFNKYLKETGINLTGEKVQNTEAFAAIMAREVINILGSGDLGAGTGISDNDRVFAAKIVGGDVTLDKNSIRQLLNLNTKVNNAKITINNRRLEALQTQRETSDPFAKRTDDPFAERTESNGLTADQLKEKLRNR